MLLACEPRPAYTATSSNPTPLPLPQTQSTQRRRRVLEFRCSSRDYMSGLMADRNKHA
ncbi:MAG: hypothetical protein ACRYE7_02030 [Janthinobacterium lividum]